MQGWDGNVQCVNRKQPPCLMPPHTVQMFSDQVPFLLLSLHLAAVKQYLQIPLNIYFVLLEVAVVYRNSSKSDMIK